MRRGDHFRPFVGSRFLLQIEHVIFLYLGFLTLPFFDFALGAMKYRDRQKYTFFTCIHIYVHTYIYIYTYIFLTFHNDLMLRQK